MEQMLLATFGALTDTAKKVAEALVVSYPVGRVWAQGQHL
jgi:hypothetical protein